MRKVITFTFFYPTFPRDHVDPPTLCRGSCARPAYGPLKLPSKQDPEHHKTVYQPRDKYHDRMQKRRRPVAWWFGVDPLFGGRPADRPAHGPVEGPAREWKTRGALFRDRGSSLRHPCDPVYGSPTANSFEPIRLLRRRNTVSCQMGGWGEF